MKAPLQVIHIEDSAEDSDLVQSLLRDEGIECKIQRVQTRADLLEALKTSKCDLILSDCTLPRFHGLEALDVAHATRPEIPFIFVSGTIGEEAAIKSLQNGATDYVLKHRLSRLVPAVHRALAEAEAKSTRKTMEGQVRLAQKLETIGTVAASLTHDFRNLLQILKMGIGLLPLNANHPEQIIKIAAQLERATDRGSRMIEDILVFAQKAEAKVAPVDLALQIRERMQILQADLPSNVSVAMNLEEDLPPALADAGQLGRILTNVILNARDAMRTGGTITVAADVIRFQSSPVKRWQSEDAPYLRMTISDTGAGMDEAALSRMFEPFYTTKVGGRGTGLGLSVVFGLMEANRGFIDVESKQGEGTAFSVFFP